MQVFTDPSAGTAEARCAECRTVLAEGQDRETTDNGLFCRPCFDNLTASLRQAIEAQGSDVNYSMAVAGGLLGGAVGVLVWWGFTFVFEATWGIVAIAIGFSVGKGVVLLTGGKRSAALQGVSVAIAMVSLVYATYLVNRTLILKQLGETGLTLPLVPDLNLLVQVLQAGFSFMDVVFAAIVAYQAWKFPAPVQLAA